MVKNGQQMRKEASLVIVEDCKNHKFLMIRHHRGINDGCINFPGGKKEPDETIEACAIRETFEETGIIIKNPVKVGYIEFPGVDFYVHIFKSSEFSGTINENKAEVDAFWQDMDNVPYDMMREADRDFLPDILAGVYVKRRYVYDTNFHIKEIVNL
ncbi:MAG: 8-oxo-dGTP diphosphatase [Alphaproteobacteria bacterium]|nr:8-oxo-dGTP diphosphatase [Alphaproteobacteria bacterium]